MSIQQYAKEVQESKTWYDRLSLYIRSRPLAIKIHVTQLAMNRHYKRVDKMLTLTKV